MILLWAEKNEQKKEDERNLNEDTEPEFLKIHKRVHL